MPDISTYSLNERSTARWRTIKSLKQGVAQEAGAAAENSYWQERYFVFNVWSRSSWRSSATLHRDPVKRVLAARPEDWRWSSFRHYALGEVGVGEDQIAVGGSEAGVGWGFPNSEDALAAEKPRSSGA